MSGELTADQAAQRLLTLLDTLGVSRQRPTSNERSKKARRSADATSISWAFHDSSDKTGFLRWLSENVETANGLTDNELELLEHLDRTDFSQADEAAVPGDLCPEHELLAQKKAVEARVSWLDDYATTLANQNAMLKSSSSRVSDDLAGLLEEEERLKKAVRAADSEAARQTAGYTGMLDEARLAAKAAMTRLRTDGGAEGGYFYQCASEQVDVLAADVHACLERVAERIADQLRRADELPSPWREFQPFATQSISGLLELASDEHRRVSGASADLAGTKLRLEVERALVAAVGEEVGRARTEGSASLLLRCKALAAKGDEAKVDEAKSRAGIGAEISSHAGRMAAAALDRVSGRPCLPETYQLLENLNVSCTELSQAQARQLDLVLESAESGLKPPAEAIQAILCSLVAEREMLVGWAGLWNTVATSLDREMAILEKQQVGLHTAAEASSCGDMQAVAPDDLLALALKRLLGISIQTSRAALVCAGPEPHELLESLSIANESGLRSRLGEGAFTGWDALLADARQSRALCDQAQATLRNKVKAAAGTERQM
ncbi:hypothetical protein GGF46_003862 [Coemansia sp. RSA 552]|nr:hypothetical protein GGF46_003862 [Coemansia sp. RSA 552]